MRVSHRRNVIRGVRDRYNEQYRNYRSEDMIGIGDARRPVGETRDALAMLDLETCSAEDVNRVVGNDSWTAHNCDECGRTLDTLMHFGDEFDYDARWQLLCVECLTKAVAELSTPT